MVERHLAVMNCLNLATAFHRLARHAENPQEVGRLRVWTGVCRPASGRNTQTPAILEVPLGSTWRLIDPVTEKVAFLDHMAVTRKPSSTDCYGKHDGSLAYWFCWKAILTPSLETRIRKVQ